MVDMANLKDAPALPEPDHKTVMQRQQAFGYTFEDLRIVLASRFNVPAGCSACLLFATEILAASRMVFRSMRYLVIGLLLELRVIHSCGRLLFDVEIL